MTMKTSCISPSCPRWSDCRQNFATASMTMAFAWVVSSETACAIWFLLGPKMGFGHKGSPVWCSVGVVPATARSYWQVYPEEGKSFPVMCLTFEGPAANLAAWISARCPSGRPFGLSDGRGGRAPQSPANQRKRGGGDDDGGDAVTAGSGDSCRIERVYLDRDRDLQVRPRLKRHCAQRTRPGGGIGRPVPRRGLRRPVLAGRVVGAGAGQQACAASCGTPATASAATTSTSAGNGGPATPCPTPR